MKRRTLTEADYVKRVNVIVEYISGHLDEDMDLKRLAEMSNFSIFHFHRVFKGIHRETLAAYITRSRVERAAYLLRYTNLSIETIAFNVGFEFPSSLSKSFRQFYNISPTAYRTNRDYAIIQRIPNLSPDPIVPKLVTLESKCVIYIRLFGEYNILDYPDIWHQLRIFAKEQNLLRDRNENIAIYHDDICVTETAKLRLDICMTINAPVQPWKEIGIKYIPGGKYAVFSYKGPFSRKSDIYDLIFTKWLPESGYEVRNLPLFEKYLNDPMESEAGKLETEVYIPIQ
jgi:AraC family transcriptional regulator